jgi:tRNA dimethylallyltransferase
MTPVLPSLVGVTGSGKTKLACRVAQIIGVEVLNADSRQIYRGLDVGTAKPTREERESCAHHLVDVADPEEKYSAARFGREARRIAEEIRARGNLPLLVGGSGLYLRAAEEGLFSGPSASPEIRRRLHQRAQSAGAAALHQDLARVDPESAARIGSSDLVRIIRALEVHEITGVPLSEHHARHRREKKPHVLRMGIEWAPPVLQRRLEGRARAMLAGGWMEEVEALLARGISERAPAWNALGYREVRDLVRGLITREEAHSRILLATRRYVKRQRTWFRGVPQIHWYVVHSQEEYDAMGQEIAARLTHAAAAPLTP